MAITKKKAKKKGPAKRSATSPRARRIPLDDGVRRRIEVQFKRRPGLLPPPGGCDITALCKFVNMMAPAGPANIPAEPYLTVLSNAINYLNGAVTAIESYLFDPSHSEVPGYPPFFLNPQPTDPPEKGGTPPPPGFPPP